MNIPFYEVLYEKGDVSFYFLIFGRLPAQPKSTTGQQ
jgi:hypothetical protein